MHPEFAKWPRGRGCDLQEHEDLQVEAPVRERQDPQVAAEVSLHLVLPLPPSVNALYRAIGRGRNILSKQGREWYATSVPLIRQQANGWFVTGRVGMRVEITWPNKLRRDISNIVKSLEDAITKAKVWNDDSQIDDLRVIRKPVDKGDPRCEVWIEAL